MTEFTTGNGVIVRVVGSGSAGPPGVGVPVGGTTGQVLAKVDGTDYNTAWATPSGGGGVSDGDKGDITVSGSGATWTVDAGSITLAKQADMATASLVYRKTAGAGAPEVNTLATLKTDLGLTGTNSGDQTSIVGITGTKSEFNTACTDGDFLFSHEWTAIETIATTSGTSAIFDNIPATYTELMFVFNGVSHDSGSAQYLYVAMSSNNGSTWMTGDVASGSSVAASVTIYGHAIVNDYNGDVVTWVSTLGNNSADNTQVRAHNHISQVVRATGGVDAIKIYPAAGNYDAGSITLKGR